MKTISIDIETFSDVNLAKCGVYKYAESPAFEILLFGYAVDGGEVQVVDLAQGESIPNAILDALTDETVIKWAFNASFERVCLSRYLRDFGMSLDPFHDHHPLSRDCARFLNPAGWKCSMIWSAYMGLPLSLEGAGAVLKLDSQKMKEGKDLIRYFCVPCKETKVNGGRTRNLPQHAPDKWILFMSYNKRDVEVEMAIQERLKKYPVPEPVWDEYHLDQEINDRGIAIDRTLAENAIAIDARSRDSLMAVLKEKTGLENPNSVIQMIGWLEQHGMKTESLGKKQVQELLKTAEGPLRSVLLLRQKLAKSSVRKYQAMEMTACEDGRARGMFQFYGANRTGRFAGRHIQLQNLPQNHLPDLSEARELVRQGNYEALELLYDSIPDVLSQLIRTAFVPRQGLKFVVSDFSAIEARVLSWLAGETWRSDVQLHVRRSRGKTWRQWPSPAERENRRTGPWLWRLRWRTEGHGCPGHGTDGKRAVSFGSVLAVGQSAHCRFLVAGGRRREDSHQGTYPHAGRLHPLPASERYAVHPAPWRTAAFLRKTPDWREPLRRGIRHL